MKKFKFKLVNRRGQIKAMEALLLWYKTGKDENFLDACPLCLEDNSCCSECVWSKETGSTCSIYNIKWSKKRKLAEDSTSERRKSRFPKWTKLRVQQLQQWIQKYQQREGE